MKRYLSIPNETISKEIINKNNIHSSWFPLLTEVFLEKLSLIEKELDKMPIHECGYAYFPEKENILRFLSCDLKTIKYVILGMEPYPSWYTDKDGVIRPIATGRSFEIGNIDSWTQKYKQSSLRNILKAVYYAETGEKLPLAQIRDKILSGEFKIFSPHDWFDDLEKQGVLFLNGTLTVLPECPDSHTKLWADIMSDVINFIMNENPTWLLFGNRAKEKVLSITCESISICCSHPRLARFVDENVFSYASDIKWTGNCEFH